MAIIGFEFGCHTLTMFTMKTHHGIYLWIPLYSIHFKDSWSFSLPSPIWTNRSPNIHPCFNFLITCIIIVVLFIAWFVELNHVKPNLVHDVFMDSFHWHNFLPWSSSRMSSLWMFTRTTKLSPRKHGTPKHQRFFWIYVQGMNDLSFLWFVTPIQCLLHFFMFFIMHFPLFAMWDLCINQCGYQVVLWKNA